MTKGILVLWTIFCGYSLFAGSSNLDPSMIQSSDAYAAGAGIGIVGILIMWGVVVIPVSLLGLLFKS